MNSRLLMLFGLAVAIELGRLLFVNDNDLTWRRAMQVFYSLSPLSFVIVGFAAAQSLGVMNSEQAEKRAEQLQREVDGMWVGVRMGQLLAGHMLTLKAYEPKDEKDQVHHENLRALLAVAEKFEASIKY